MNAEEYAKFKKDLQESQDRAAKVEPELLRLWLAFLILWKG